MFFGAGSMGAGRLTLPPTADSPEPMLRCYLWQRRTAAALQRVRRAIPSDRRQPPAMDGAPCIGGHADGR